MLRRFALLLVVLGVIAAIVLGYEFRTSRFQSRYFTRITDSLDTRLAPGPSPAIRFPGRGPYDVRYGYHRLPDVIASLERAGFVVDSQARNSWRFLELVDMGFSPIYREKDQAGLLLQDRDAAEIFSLRLPARRYSDFDSIPRLVWQSLLFVEDRDLIRAPSPWHNPAVNWARLFRAATSLGGRRLGRDGPVAGGSTLATQIEKFRHAPDGQTQSPRDKLLQMASASARVYMDGAETAEARRRIVTTYLNAAPFGGIPGLGEVTGLGDALHAWYDADFDEVNRLLREAGEPDCVPDPATHGRAFRLVLQLIMAVQRPSYFLADSAGRQALIRRADGYLELLAREGIVPRALATAARAPALSRSGAPPAERPSFVAMKAVNAARSELLGVTGIRSLYELDRLDATARATVDGPLQARVTDYLVRLRDSAFLESQGLRASRLLARGDPARVTYAVLLYERTPQGNVVRVQADNVDAPFSPIEGAKLELGSTAKLRTLVTWLETVERLWHDARSDSSAAVMADASDPLTVWTREFLAKRPEATLRETLDAAMERRYSASPRERFFTGGGLHTFGNFERVHDGQVMTVTDAFRNSVNLVFIRMMRDIVAFHTNRLPGHPALGDRDHPMRQQYLQRFADREGRVFLDRFLRKHTWQTSDGALDALLRDRTLSPARLAWLVRAVEPDSTVERFQVVLQSQGHTLSRDRARELYDRAEPWRYTLQDRGYLAGIHPLELWLVEFRLRHPGATRAEVMDSSRDVRLEVYHWLFSSRLGAAQDLRIRSILEVEAFFEIHKAWRRLGYPFASLVPSYATAIGSSADRPDQLAELVGILVNDGVRRPSFRVGALRLAPDTPYETVMHRESRDGERVLSSDLSAVVRDAMIGVVSGGTGRRAAGAVRAPDGTPVPIGAKTGTGNNRFRVAGRGGRLIEDRAINRTATVTFFIGDRYYGAITAFVPGAQADDYDFTSSLPVQILRAIGGMLDASQSSRRADGQ